jgi:hypothetical protein
MVALVFVGLPRPEHDFAGGVVSSDSVRNVVDDTQSVADI